MCHQRSPFGRARKAKRVARKCRAFLSPHITARQHSPFNGIIGNECERGAFTQTCSRCVVLMCVSLSPLLLACIIHRVDYIGHRPLELTWIFVSPRTPAPESGAANCGGALARLRTKESSLSTAMCTTDEINLLTCWWMW